MSDILRIGVSGLNVAQYALNTTGNNISNVNTEGYTRQRVDQVARADQNLGGIALGKGVDAANVERVMNDFLNINVRNSGTNVGQMSSYTRYASQVDGVISDDVAGLSSSLQAFFDSVNAVADDPASVPARQTMLSEGASLTAKLNSLDYQLGQLNTGINAELKANVTEINTITSELAVINRNIAQLGGASGSNSLMDQRDQLLNELAQKIGITTTNNGNGSINVTTMGGQALVVDGTSFELGTQVNPERPTELDITYTAGASTTVITDAVAGGEMRGLLDVREEVVRETRNALGRLGAGLAMAFNTQQAAGDDLDGVTGANLFSIGSPQVTSQAGMTGVLNVSFDSASIANLTTSDYRVSFDGTNYTAVRLADNTTVYNGTGTSFSADGLDFNFSTGAAAGDSYLVQPMRQVANSISMATDDPRKIAAANSGNGIGDNANILAMADLQLTSTLEGGTASFTDAYSQLIGDIGSKTRQMETGLASMEAVQASAVEARDSVSGVNLDEEAANLLKFQQAYQAAARVISVGNDVFTSLLQAVGR